MMFVINPIECQPLNVRFVTFWDVYPRKQNKKGAEKAFEKLKDVDKWNAIQGAAYQAVNNPQWKNPAYIPLPTTYLNQRRWEDEVAPDKDAKTRVVERQDKSPAHTVWSAMTQMYGDAWVKKHGEEPTEIWRKLLSTMSEEQIKKGLRATFDSGNEFPPSLPRFAEYCKGAPSLPEAKALPRPEGNYEVQMAAIDEMKKILGID